MLTGRGLPFHCATEHEETPLPVAVMATGCPVKASTAVNDGESAVMLGVGSSVVEGSCVSENFTEFELVPAPPETVMATAAAFVAK